MSRLTQTAFPFALGALLAIALTGCSKVKNVIDLKADGSGIATLTIRIEQTKLEQLMDMAAQMGGPTANVEDLLDFAKTGKALAHIEGVRLVSQKSLDDAEKKIRGTEMVVAFDSLEALAKSGLLKDIAVDLTKGDDGNYTLKMQFKPKGVEQFDLSDPATQQMFEQQKMMIEPMVGGFELSDVLKLTTAVTETNGTKAETGGNSVMWNVRFENADLSKLTRTVSFSGEGLDWKPFSVSASAGRKALGAARAKIAGASGPTAMPGSAAELETRLAAEKARIAALEQAVSAAKQAANQARQAATEAEKTAEQMQAELTKAQEDLAKLAAELEKLKQPAGADDK